jgi:hypothetical protein
LIGDLGPIVEAMKIDVVLPCLNEEAALPWVLGRMPHGYRAIVVDLDLGGRVMGETA